MTVLNIPADYVDGIFSLVSAVLHIGNLEFQASGDGEETSLTPKDEQTVKKVAQLLKVSLLSTLSPGYFPRQL